MKRRHWSRHQVKPVWHTETCVYCGHDFEERSDPRASMHVCNNCLRSRFQMREVDRPLQKSADQDQWWNDFIQQYDADLAAGRIDQVGRKI